MSGIEFTDKLNVYHTKKEICVWEVGWGRAVTARSPHKGWKAGSTALNTCKEEEYLKIHRNSREYGSVVIASQATFLATQLQSGKDFPFLNQKTVDFRCSHHTHIHTHKW